MLISQNENDDNQDVQEVFEKMNNYFESNFYKSFKLQIVSYNYYQESLEWRADVLKAPSSEYLCKTILMENTVWDETLASNQYPRFVCVVIQYITKINADKVMKWARNLSKQKIGKSKFHFRLVPPELAYQITGYKYNALTPYCMSNNQIPLVINDKITKLPGQFLWLGGGHVDIKLRLGIQECVDKYPDYVYFADVVYDE